MNFAQMLREKSRQQEEFYRHVQTKNRLQHMQARAAVRGTFGLMPREVVRHILWLTRLELSVTDRRTGG